MISIVLKQRIYWNGDETKIWWYYTNGETTGLMYWNHSLKNFFKDHPFNNIDEYGLIFNARYFLL